jgi:hypothetical protein
VGGPGSELGPDTGYPDWNSFFHWSLQHLKLGQTASLQSSAIHYSLIIIQFDDIYSERLAALKVSVVMIGNFSSVSLPLGSDFWRDANQHAEYLNSIESLFPASPLGSISPFLEIHWPMEFPL